MALLFYIRNVPSLSKSRLLVGIKTGESLILEKVIIVIPPGMLSCTSVVQLSYDVQFRGESRSYLSCCEVTCEKARYELVHARIAEETPRGGCHRKSVPRSRRASRSTLP